MNRAHSVVVLFLLVPLAAAAICETELSTFQACILDDTKADTECLPELTTYWACVTNTKDLDDLEVCNRQYFDIYSVCAQAAGNCAQCSLLESAPADCNAANSNWCQGSWATCCRPCQAWANDYATCLNNGACTAFPPEPQRCASSGQTVTLKYVAVLFISLLAAMHFA